MRRQKKESSVAADLKKRKAGFKMRRKEQPTGSTRRRATASSLPMDGGSEDPFVHYTGITASGCKSLKEGAGVSYEVAQDRKGMRAIDVSTGSTERPGSRGTGYSLGVALEVEGAARILAEHFDSDNLYWLIVETVRRKQRSWHNAAKGLRRRDGVSGRASRMRGSRRGSR